MSNTPIHNEIDQMFRVMSKHSRFGAMDTEPRGAFAQILHDFQAGTEPSIPTTAEGWGLFTSIEGSERVATLLSDQAHKVVAVANSDYRAFREAAPHFIDEL